MPPTRETVRSRSETRYNLQAFASWSDDMAYALGLFFSDGCVQQPPRGSLRVSFSNTDLETVRWWHQYLGNTTSIYTHKTKVLGGITRHQVLYTSNATSDTLGRRILELGGCLRKSTSDVRMPSIPEEYLGSFLRGFFDGDGGIWIGSGRGMLGGKQLCVSLTANSQRFRHDLVEVLANRGIRTVTTRITLKISGSSAEKLCAWLYGSTGHRMARKADVWGAWQDHRKSLGGLIVDSDPWSSLRGVRAQPWHERVGTMSDAALARQIGLTHGAVSFARQKLGIPVFKPSRQSPKHKSWHDLVGKMPDTDVSRLGSVSRSSVCLYRKQMGIPVFQQTEVCDG
jgi:hypothetical protein